MVTLLVIGLNMTARYLDEFETRWDFGDLDSGARMDTLLESVSGLRVTYKELIR